MMVLLTGSAGKTASALAEALTPEHKVLVASRRPSAEHTHPTVKFDWLDDSTWSNVFDHSQAKEAPISAVYLVFPDLPEARANGLPFLRLCIKQGVKRFALLSAWENPEGGPLMGGLHADLKALGQKEGIEWAVLRPHFFMENFAETYHLDTIRHEGKVYSGAGEGRKPFIAARDIAAVAKRALVDEKPLNRDCILTGPEPLTYNKVAEILSDVLGTKIQHVSLDAPSFQAKLSGFGATAEMAEYMSELDQKVLKGAGKEPTDAVRSITGTQPQTFRQWVQANRSKWL